MVGLQQVFIDFLMTCSETSVSIKCPFRHLCQAVCPGTWYKQAGLRDYTSSCATLLEFLQTAGDIKVHLEPRFRLNERQ